MSRIPHVWLTLAAIAGALTLSRRLGGDSEARIAALEYQREQLAAEAQRALRARDDFLATLSHELRTPLNALLGWVQLLRVHDGDAAMRAHALDVIERNARAQVQLVSDLLDVSRVITGRMRLAFEPVDLVDVVRGGADTLAATAAAKNVTLVVEVHPLTGTVSGDAARLRQVVWNMLSNAIKFTPCGGRIVIRLSPEGGSAEISVADTGVGIDPDVLPFVFDRFRQADSSLTRSFGGLGLGLAIVRHLVELHGGSVGAYSDGPNRGATFVARLPMRTSLAS